MDLFDYMREKDMERESLLASRLHPRTLDEVVGQQHIVGEDKLLYRTIQVDKLSSIIPYESSGAGKTTLAKVVANTTSADFRQINTTMAGKRDMEEVVKEVRGNIGVYRRKIILFVDEIHRFSKGQQDYLLLFTEDGTLILVGITTESPYFEINGAFLPKFRIFKLKSLEKGDVKELIRRAVYNKGRGMDIYGAEIDRDAAGFLADTVNGDVGAALNAVELGVLITAKGPDGWIHIDMAVVQGRIRKRAVRYDRNGDNHYGTISVFIKSMQGSDPDAVMYYLARVLYAGEDIKFIARRITICVTEGVGNANPQALVATANAAQAAEHIGLPGVNIILSRVATYVATAPKSSVACMAVQKTIEAVRNERTMPVPAHLQDKYYKGAEKLGHGAGHRYAHDCPGRYVQQRYLPDSMEGTIFYEPSGNGYGRQINVHMKWPKS